MIVGLPTLDGPDWRCQTTLTLRTDAAHEAQSHHCFEEAAEKSIGGNAFGALRRAVLPSPAGEVGLETPSDVPSSSVIANVVFLLISSFGAAETLGEAFDFWALLLERAGIFTTPLLVISYSCSSSDERFSKSMTDS